jgi:ferritin-like metal-binding protein YciE
VNFGLRPCDRREPLFGGCLVHDAILRHCLERYSTQRVEHYEIAGYGCVKTYARLLGYEDAAKLLEETQSEEVATDEKLTEAAESINVEAEKAEEETEEEEPKSTASSRRR